MEEELGRELQFMCGMQWLGLCWSMPAKFGPMSYQRIRKPELKRSRGGLLEKCANCQEAPLQHLHNLRTG